MFRSVGPLVVPGGATLGKVVMGLRIIKCNQVNGQYWINIMCIQLDGWCYLAGEFIGLGTEWPVQVCRVEEDTVSLVYYETGDTNVVPKSSADLVPFTQQTIENLKLDQMKSRKLQKAIAAAKASMWVVIISIQLSENDCALSIALICSIVSTELSRNCKRHVVLANISYSYPQPREQALRPKFPKSVTCEQSLRLIPRYCIVVSNLIQITSTFSLL